MKLRMLLFAALLVTLSCAAPDDWQGTIEERDGAVFVSNLGEGLWQDRDQPPIHFELEQVFGADIEPREAILGRTFQIYRVEVEGR